MSSRPKVETHPLERSSFYRMGRQRDIAGLLNLEMKDLKRLARDRESQYWRNERDIGGKLRTIVCPFGRMRRVHERLQALFNRIEQPDYLQSPRRGRTAAGNADIHRFANSIGKLDIRQFYPSTTDEHVFRFFRHRMQMPDDVAGLVTKLCTVHGRLPFGSPLSPILCTLVHRDLFDQIWLTCQSASLKMTLWVDDITLSGEEVSSRVLWEIKRIINAKGLRYHKVAVRQLRRGAVVTGLYLHSGGVAAANKHHVGVRDSLRELDAATDDAARLKLIRSLIGKTDYARRIYVPSTSARNRLDSRRDWLHTQRRRLQQKPIITQPITPPSPHTTSSVILPWEDENPHAASGYLLALSGIFQHSGNL